MYKYDIDANCYYAEKGRTPQYYKKGERYCSETLTPDKAPYYFKLVSSPKYEIATETENTPQKEVSELEIDGIPLSKMDYIKLKQYVHDNGIKTSNFKSETLIGAVSEFLITKEREKKEREETAKLKQKAREMRMDVVENPTPPESPIENNE